jgi:hypothetical protein
MDPTTYGWQSSSPQFKTMVREAGTTGAAAPIAQIK